MARLRSRKNVETSALFTGSDTAKRTSGLKARLRCYLSLARTRFLGNHGGSLTGENWREGPRTWPFFADDHDSGGLPDLPAAIPDTIDTGSRCSSLT
ncbi:hypothetical protein RRG08_034954 [Elysia crispata]|uniref:Uncharacterized protein n=1 Tax=Elysia crispata TaxID=231223 RepID=A0AAE0Y2H5_9GAST|nr:hypothetical protein RRG08_034954 [Elysia crispata]